MVEGHKRDISYPAGRRGQIRDHDSGYNQGQGAGRCGGGGDASRGPRKRPRMEPETMVGCEEEETEFKQPLPFITARDQYVSCGSLVMV